MNLNSFIQIDKEAEPLPETVTNIEFKDCSFKYPETDNFVLKDINISISHNQKIAIVGPNGAGKTTLLKLLMRFYDPTSGSIIVSNNDIKKYDVKKYRASIGSVFQDFQLFEVSVGENVLMNIVEEKSKVRIMKALELASFDNCFSNMKNAVDTVISKEFSNDGGFLSGGQAQMIAIARVFVKDNLFIVLDEASSALDPLTEAKINEKLMELSADKTVIFISHRLSVTQYVDRIYVMSDGTIIEQGTHNQLMLLNGLYNKMFTVQAQKYNI